MWRSIQSQKWFRFQASLIAFLYVFLCTIGALTHSHASLESGLDVATRGRATALHSDTNTATHCAYCDWQADSVSPALALKFCIGIETARVVLSTLSLSSSRVLASRASSRAPPLA